MGRKLPQLTQMDYVRLDAYVKGDPVSFYSNQTQFLLREMRSYIRDARIWRISIMGETRSGKSESAQTLAKIYVDMFNEALEAGLFDNLDVWEEEFKKQKISLEVDYIMGNQGEYINSLRECQREGRIRFGQIWIVDESKESSGGIGSYSEKVDLNNVNNIIAKFMQSEIWVTPPKFEMRNSPYGLKVYKKDLKERVNWCLLFKIEMSPQGQRVPHFLGWVKIPLHQDDKLRKDYNAKKNKWISEEIQGGGDARMEARKEIARRLADDPVFSQMSKNGKQFELNKEQQMIMIEHLISDGETINWNESEKYRIMNEARLVCTQRRFQQGMGNGISNGESKHIITPKAQIKENKKSHKKEMNL